MLQIQRNELLTEQRNPRTARIDEASTLDMLRLINAEDKLVPLCIEKILPDVAAAVDLIAERLQNGGRLFYIGAGTSGRLGVLDAAECPPTYGVSSAIVQGIIAGGEAAIFKAQEGVEDDPARGAKDLEARNLSSADVVVGIAASGRTPYVLGAMRYAKKIGAPTIGISCSPNAPLEKIASIALVAAVGPEVVTGSTRMKAGTAQKLLLNMLSTGAMIRLGKVYGNLMIDVRPSNAKLVERARRIVMEAAGVNYEESCAYLQKSGNDVKLAVFMLLSGLERDEAAAVLRKNGGYLARSLQSLRREVERGGKI